VILIM